ncbi:MAG: Asp-tRNA(Asn)/Glu-tRNA(Gln) amidotransferase subunit GatC [bacterium]
MAITKKEIEHVARLARIAFTDKEKASFTEQLNRILEYISQLQEVDTSSVEPMAQPVPLSNVFRQDTVVPSTTEEELLSNAPEREDGFFKVKKVIE